MINIDFCENKIITKTDLFDLTNYEIVSRFTGFSFALVKFNSKNNPLLKAEVSITVKDKKPLYNDFTISFYKVIMNHNECYGIKNLHKEDGPAVIVFKDNKPIKQAFYINGSLSNYEGPAEISDIKKSYYIDGIKIDRELFEKLKNSCKKDEIDFSINYTNKYVRLLELTAKHYKANNILNNIDNIRVMLKLINSNEDLSSLLAKNAPIV